LPKNVLFFEINFQTLPSPMAGKFLKMAHLFSFSTYCAFYLNISQSNSLFFSIVMTTVSTIFSLGTMPLWLFVFPIIIGIENNCLRVPFDALGIVHCSIRDSSYECELTVSERRKYFLDSVCVGGGGGGGGGFKMEKITSLWVFWVR